MVKILDSIKQEAWIKVKVICFGTFYCNLRYGIVLLSIVEVNTLKLSKMKCYLVIVQNSFLILSIS